MALEGDMLHLHCDYEDESGSSLYTLKWYKDGLEFYRHLPGIPHTPDHRCLDTYVPHVEGVAVDVSWAETAVHHTQEDKGEAVKGRCMWRREGRVRKGRREIREGMKALGHRERYLRQRNDIRWKKVSTENR